MVDLIGSFEIREKLISEFKTLFENYDLDELVLFLDNTLELYGIDMAKIINENKGLRK